jgi:ribonucleotide reductase alpha subunit
MTGWDRQESEGMASALRVLEARYPRRAATGRVIESTDRLFSRVARAVPPPSFSSGRHGRQVLAPGADEEAVTRDFLIECDPGACRL